MKSVLITGGSGSFGQAYTADLLKDQEIKRIVIYSRGEHLQEEMAAKFDDPRLRFFIGDVRDRKRLEMAMSGIDTVIHAAALKIVPTAEYNPTECVATNIGGAENVVMACIAAGVRRCVFLSTDKAVNPVNLYGATKLAAEKIAIAANNLAGGKSLFSVVRYGNVVGSRGSVLPLFLKLAKEGKSLPVTDPAMTRFWITMKAAIHMVNVALSEMKGREVFIPKIPSIKIIDLARAIYPQMHIVGIRPGEKLHEVLVTEDDARNAIDMKTHYVIRELKPSEKGMPHDFRYSSDSNREWLGTDQLREMIYGEHD